MAERLRVAKKVRSDLRLRRKSDPNARIHVVVRTPHGSEERDFPDLSFKEDDQLWALLRYPYVGKGSPESIEVALQLAAADKGVQRS
jgi:hypothetical protein